MEGRSRSDVQSDLLTLAIELRDEVKARGSSLAATILNKMTDPAVEIILIHI